MRLLWHGMLPGWPLTGLFEDNSASCGSGWHASEATTALAAAVLAAVTVLLLKREWSFTYSPRPCSSHRSKVVHGNNFHYRHRTIQADRAQLMRPPSKCCSFRYCRPPLLPVLCYFNQGAPPLQGC